MMLQSILKTKRSIAYPLALAQRFILFLTTWLAQIGATETVTVSVANDKFSLQNQALCGTKVCSHFRPKSRMATKLVITQLLSWSSLHTIGRGHFSKLSSMSILETSVR